VPPPPPGSGAGGGQWGPPPGPPPSPSPYGPPGGQQNTKAITGLVVGIIGLIMAFCCSFLGVPLGAAATILGYLAKHEIAHSDGRQAQSTGMAQGAFVIGIIATALSVAMIIFGVVANVGMSSTDWNTFLD
jgi:hypothetical protein